MKSIIAGLVLFFLLTGSVSAEYVKACLTIMTGGLSLSLYENGSYPKHELLVNLVNEKGKIVATKNLPSVMNIRRSYIEFYRKGRYKFTINSSFYEKYESEYYILDYSTCGGNVERKEVTVNLIKKEPGKKEEKY